MSHIAIYKTPKIKLGELNETKTNGNQRQKIKNILPKTEYLRGLDSLRIWENMSDKMREFIEKNEQGRDCIPSSVWFIKNEPRLTGSFPAHKGYTTIVKRLQQEGNLGHDCIIVKGTGENARIKGTGMEHLGDEKKLYEYMLGVCEEFGYFPKKSREMKDMGHGEAMTIILKHYENLSEVEAHMRNEGLLDDYPEKKKQ